MLAKSEYHIARERHGNPHCTSPRRKGNHKINGERLVCIRYRYDPSRGKRYKTIELIIGEEDWQPPAPHPYEQEPRQKAPERFHTRRVGVRIAYNESELRKQIKAAGGMWDPSERLWFIPEEYVRRLGLVQRVAKR